MSAQRAEAARHCACRAADARVYCACVIICLGASMCNVVASRLVMTIAMLVAVAMVIVTVMVIVVVVMVVVVRRSRCGRKPCLIH